MMIRARAVAVTAGCILWACTSAPPPPGPAPHGPELAPELAPELTTERVGADLDEESSVTTVAMLPPTAAMLKAALGNDPDAMRDAAAATLLACQAASTCPAQFGSCSSWSTSTLCSETCGPGVCFCRPVRECEGEPPEPRGTNTYNSFRVCFDPAQHACTEWTNTSTTICGC